MIFIGVVVVFVVVDVDVCCFCCYGCLLVYFVVVVVVVVVVNVIDIAAGVIDVPFFADYRYSSGIIEVKLVVLCYFTSLFSFYIIPLNCSQKANVSFVMPSLLSCFRV